MSVEKRFVAFDLGAENGRCFVAVLKDARLELKEVHRFETPTKRSDAGLFWDAQGIFHEVTRGLEEARKGFGPDFDGIGVDTWGVDYALIDGEGKLIGLPYHYRDDRTDGMMDEGFKLVPKEELYRRTGIQFNQINTLFQLLSEKKRKPNSLSVADKILLMPDFINYLLSGRAAAEFTIVSTTGLGDPGTRNWAWDIVEKLGLQKRIFPDVVEPGFILGSVLPSVAKKTGLSPETPVIATAGHDTASAVASIPSSRRANWAFLSSGTWSLFGIEANEAILSPRAMEYNFTNEGGVGGTTRFLKNITGLWPLQECRRSWSEKSEKHSYQALTDLAMKEEHTNAWVDLDDQRFLKPGNMPGKIMSYLKETGQASKEDIGFTVGVILESLAFCYRMTRKEIEEVTGMKISSIHVVGGGIQNELLMQMTADALNCRVIAGPTEGAVIGNVGVQAIATGAVRDIDGWRSIVSASFDTRVYEPHETGYFDSNERAYRGILTRSRAGEV